MIQILKLSVGDLLQLKKAHPCGGATFRVMRVGAQVRIVCTTCKRDMTMERVKLEKAVKQLIPAQDQDSTSNRKEP